MQSWAAALHPLEVRVIRAFNSDDIIDSQVLINKLGYNVGQANQAISWLTSKKILRELSRKIESFYEITNLGKDWISNNPALRMRELARSQSLTISEMIEALSIDQATAGKIFGQYSKDKVLSLDNFKKIIEISSEVSYWDEVQETLQLCEAMGGILDSSQGYCTNKVKDILKAESKKRGSSNSLFRLVEKEVIKLAFDADSFLDIKSTIEKMGLTGEEIGSLTSAMLRDGSWRDKNFRQYGLKVPVSKLMIGRRNPYAQYIESIKDKLANLGFQEFDGPIVETEFWNNDALFMPQFHSARDIHDVYYVKNPQEASSIEEPYLSNVAKAHESGEGCDSLGWRYPFDRNFTKRLILRSQGTVLSAKELTKAKIPGKYFGIARCFRYDQVDATHGADFYQTEGIVLGDDVNLKTLLGLLELFAKEFAGAEEVKYVPAYFPFTEPSIEIHIKHPVLGWFELGGSGIFRPEVTKPLGIHSPVIAWGIGIDRMALMYLGLNDLRDLFSMDIDSVRLRRANHAQS